MCALNNAEAMNMGRPNHIQFTVITITLFIVLILFYSTSFDFYVVSKFYDQQNGWIFRNSFLFENILHRGGSRFMIVFYITAVLRTIYLYYKKKNYQEIVVLVFVICVSISSISIVALLKQLTTLPCPWDLSTFSGNREHQSIFSLFDYSYSRGRCFPAGHSSATYSLLSYYFGKKLLNNGKLIYLLPGILLGLLFGCTQQIRGAHFPSHDIATILIVVLSSWCFSIVFYKNFSKEIPHVKK